MTTFVTRASKSNIDGKYPAVYARFSAQNGASPLANAVETHGTGEICYTGHFDVVEPEPDDSQFIPRIEGDYLWGAVRRT